MTDKNGAPKPPPPKPPEQPMIPRCSGCGQLVTVCRCRDNDLRK